MTEINVDRVEKPAELVVLDERQLLPRHRRGDPEAFRELISAYRAPVYGYLVRCSVPLDVRDDIFQDIFFKVHVAATTYQPDRPLKPWIFTIVANTVRSFFRKRRVEALVYPEKVPSHVNSDSLERTQARETAAWLVQVISRLPLVQREVVTLSCIERCSIKEVANILDLPLGTAKTHLHRARLALTRALARRETKMRREVDK